MKSNQTLNVTLYLFLTVLDIFESIMEKGSNRRSDICFYVRTCLMYCLNKLFDQDKINELV